jgi:hypothetical protein
MKEYQTAQSDILLAFTALISMRKRHIVSQMLCLTRLFLFGMSHFAWWSCKSTAIETKMEIKVEVGNTTQAHASLSLSP